MSTFMELNIGKTVEMLHEQYSMGLITFTDYVEQLQLVHDAMASYGAMHGYFGKMDDKTRRVLAGLDKE